MVRFRCPKCDRRWKWKDWKNFKCSKCGHQEEWKKYMNWDLMNAKKEDFPDDLSNV